MRWEDERYVRIYTRDTAEWLALGWEAQALLVLALRKMDRAGIIELGRTGARGLAAVVGMPPDLVERALQVLLEDGCLVLSGTTLVAPNFIEAQEAKQSDAQRKRESRARARDLAAAEAKGVTNPDGTTPGAAPVTNSDGSPASGHESRRAGHEIGPHPRTPVTPSLAVPSRAEPAAAARASGETDDPLGAFRRALAAELAIASANPLRLAKRHLAPELREHVERLGGPEAAAAACAAACRDRGKTPSTLDYVATFIADLEPAPDQARERGENPKPGDADFNDPAAWRDYGEFLERDDGKGLGFKPPVYKPPLTPEEEAEQRAKAGGRS